MIKINNFLLITIFFFIVIPSVLSLYDNEWSPLTGIGIFLFVSINFMLIIIKKWTISVPYILGIFFIGLMFFSLISFFVVGKLKPIINYGALIALFVVVNIVSNKIKNTDIDRLIVSIVVLSSLSLFIIICLSINSPFLGEFKPLTFRRYSGFFTNANSMGMYTAWLLHMLIGVLFAFHGRLNRSITFFLYLTTIVSFVYLLASNSRAAILSVFLVILTIIVIKISKTFNFFNLKIRINYFNSFLKFTILISLFFLLIVLTGALDNTIEKFFIKRLVEVGDASDGRVDGWLFAIKNWNWFGYPNFVEYAYENGMLRVGHSTWISHLNDYGIINALFFVSWLLFMLIWAWKKIMLENFSGSHIIFFTTLLGFFVNASFQSATSTPGLSISIIMFGILFKRKEIS
tara:strand:- start:15363 stop:16571 length:1209 start_codon:yes stop_codon:yes gene_type:complete